jgi:GxxExxY protein
LVLPEMSYQIIGALFDVFHDLGFGYREKYYYPAIKASLKKRGLQVKTQVKVNVQFQDKKIADIFLDFLILINDLLINDLIILEIKLGARFRKPDFDQVKTYLKATGKPLAILARISKDGVTFHRVLPPLLHMSTNQRKFIRNH